MAAELAKAGCRPSIKPAEEPGVSRIEERENESFESSKRQRVANMEWLAGRWGEFYDALFGL